MNADRANWADLDGWEVFYVLIRVVRAIRSFDVAYEPKTINPRAILKKIRSVQIRPIRVQKMLPSPASLPLDRARRLRRNIVDDSIHPANFACYARGNLRQEIVR